ASQETSDHARVVLRRGHRFSPAHHRAPGLREDSFLVSRREQRTRSRPVPVENGLVFPPSTSSESRAEIQPEQRRLSVDESSDTPAIVIYQSSRIPPVLAAHLTEAPVAEVEAAAH